MEIIEDAKDFIEAGERLLCTKNEAWLIAVDKYLDNISWDQTCYEMLELIEKRISNKEFIRKKGANHV